MCCIGFASGHARLAAPAVPMDAAGRERQRIGFRARPVDINTRLVIIRSPEERADLGEEATVSRQAAHSHVALDRENEEARPDVARALAGGQAVTAAPASASRLANPACEYALAIFKG